MATGRAVEKSYRRISIICTLFGGLFAAPLGVRAWADEPNFPACLSAALDERRSFCAESNKQLKLGPLAIRRLDLSGEGNADYILDDSAVSCGDEHGWCGSGGCSVSIYMQTANGYAEVYNDLAQSVQVSPRRKGYQVVVTKRIGPGDRLVFDNGCAVDLAHDKSRSCKVDK